MAAVQEDDLTAPSIRFKRRKITNPKRSYLADDAPTLSSNTAILHDAQLPANEASNEEEAVPNLKEILRNRRRRRDRLKEAVNRSEAPRTELVQVDAPRPDQYTSRFIAQTGQVVDRDDKQMTTFVEARLAEQNFRQYGWPIPTHLQTAVASIAPDLKHTFALGLSTQGASAAGKDGPVNVEYSNRLAAGQGKLQEVDLGPAATARTEKAWAQLEGKEPADPTGKRRDKYGYQWRNPKRRNSEDVRRDQMVEAVMRESKLDYFDDSAPVNHPDTSDGNNEDALVERFRREYFESMEAQAQYQRKPAAPPIKGAPEIPKGPKLGGSKSARAKMRLQQEEALKKKR